jgi:hypothetical protein
LSWRPSVAEERWLAVEAGGHRTSGWKTTRLLRRCVFFALGLAAAGLTYAFFDLVRWRAGGWTAAVVLLVTAEWLIRARRLFASGIEEALEWSAVLLLVTQLLQARTHVPDVQIAALLSAATGLAGIRLLNPLLTTLGLAGLSIVVQLWTSADGHPVLTSSPAGFYCFAIAALALLSSTLDYRRPSHDRMMGWAIVSMPPVGYAWLGGFGGPHVLPALALSMFGIAALGVGILRRAHAPLLAFLACTACAAYQLRHLSALSPEARLIGGGAAALLLAVALDRYLRITHNGFTSIQVDEKNAASFDLLQMAGTAALAPQAGPGAERFKGEGGTFGGGGAGGSY